MILFYLAVAIQVAILGGLVLSIHLLRRSWSSHDSTEHRSKLIDVLGNFVADVLDHPRVKLCLAETVANGMNHTMAQPDLGLRLQQVSESMREHNLQMSRTIGEQLPALAANFMGGAMSSMVSSKKRSSKRNLSTSSETQGSREVKTLTLESSESSLGDKKVQ